LQEHTAEGVVKFYEEAEEVPSHLPRVGIPMHMRRIDDETAKPYSIPEFQTLVQRVLRKIAMQASFTLDACRQGGMTELEVAELTDRQGRALSAHTSDTYNGYAKRMLKRALAATRKRHAPRARKRRQERVGNKRSEWAAEKRSE
jgi:hypothetical protein